MISRLNGYVKEEDIFPDVRNVIAQVFAAVPQGKQEAFFPWITGKEEVQSYWDIKFTETRKNFKDVQIWILSVKLR